MTMAVDIGGGAGGETAAVPGVTATAGTPLETATAGALAFISASALRTGVAWAGPTGGAGADVGEKAACGAVALGEAGTDAASYTIWAAVDADAVPGSGASALPEANRRDRFASPVGLEIGSGSSYCVRGPSAGAPGNVAGKTAAISVQIRPIDRLWGAKLS